MESKVRSGWGKVGAALAALIILTGLTVATLRWVLPSLVVAHRADVVRIVAERSGLDVQMDSLGLSFAGWRPRLFLEGVHLRDRASGAPILDLRRISLDLDLLASLQAGTLRVGGASLEGASLEVRLRPDGALGVAGLEGFHGGGGGRALGFFLAQGSLRLRDSQVVWVNERLGGPPLRLVEVAIDLDNREDRHWFSANGRLASGQAASIEVRGDLSGQEGGASGIAGRVYARLSGRDLGRRLAAQTGTEVALRANGTLEFWADIEAGRVRGLAGRFELQELALTAPGGEQFEAEHLGGVLGWRARDDGWDLDLREFSLQRGGRVWSAAASLWAGHKDEGDERLALGVDHLGLADAAALVRVLFPARPELGTILSEAQPAGMAKDLQGVAYRSREGEWIWSGRVELVGVAVAPQGRWPGIQGLQAEVTADSAGGVARLSSEGLAIQLPKLFRDTLNASRLTGDLGWRLTPGAPRLELWSPELVVENPDLETRSGLAIELPLDGGVPVLDIETAFRNGDASHTGRYLPVGIMPSRVVQWLDTAIVSGRIPQGWFRLHGTPQDFPYRDRQGGFEVSFEVEDLIVDYQPHWPRIQGLGAKVRFLNQGLEISANQGRLLGSRIEQAQARIADLQRAPSLVLKGSISGPFSDGLGFLRESPLADEAGSYVRAMTGRGDGRYQLDLTLPLGEGQAHRVTTLVGWRGDASLRLPDGGLSLDQVEGTLRFGDGVLSSKGLRARVLGQPVDLELATLDEAGKRITRLQVRARLGPATLARLYPSSAWRWLKGESAWRLRLDLMPRSGEQRNGSIRFALESDLLGLGVDLPAPLGKAAPLKRPLGLTGELWPGSELRLDGTYAGLWTSLAWVRSADQGWRWLGGDVGSGKPEGGVKPREGLRVRLDLEALDPAAWARWWTKAGLVGSQRAGADLLPPLGSFDLGVKRLDLAGARFPNVNVQLGETEGARWLRVVSPAMEGRIEWPRTEGDPLVVTVQALDLKTLRKEGGAEDRKALAGAPLDPRGLPPFALKIADLRWGETPIGTLEAKARSGPEGLEIDPLRLEGPRVTVSGTARWTQSAAGQQRTSLKLEGHSDDLGQLLRHLDFGSSLERASAQATLALAWPEAPEAPRLDGLVGHLEFLLGAGNLQDVNPGLGRVLGIVNLGALRRRLTLDFSDLFQKGFAFDAIEGSVDLSGGLARTEKLRIDAPSAVVEARGETDLRSHQLDQWVTVTADLSSSLAVAGAVAGGPLVGAAVLVVDRVIGDQLDKLSRTEYRVTGPWDNPVFVRIGATAGDAAGKGAENPFLNQ